ncbi:protein-disulfide isomerase [Roseiconus lacunae]|uniref:tetratricopeptide repeat protein n=1 Tax=Roseiconus lacunae TaxID=2605694 RepID=UPI0030928937|nr:protein-disulfide isomerase [Stieleria sp. HD01]
MSVDSYAICPCGNGKKIKFCKCKDSVSQMEKVLRMVEGGQVVPALDRLKSILEEHPDAAWALAIRGRLLLGLQEFDSLAENAERFIRLQPSNPLALTQRAAVSVAKGEMQTATDSLLEALNESGQSVDAFVMDVALLVAMGLAQSGSVLSARQFAFLPLGASGFESDEASGFMESLDQSQAINLLLKHIPELIDCPDGVEWQERYDEAMSLLSSNKILLAQDKFESLRRTAPGQAAVLSGLFCCAIWRGDIDRQSDIARQLSEVEDLDLLERQRYGAIAALLKERDVLAVQAANIRVEFKDVEQAEMALAASNRCKQMEAAQLSRLRIDEESVPPRSAFFIADREIPADDADVSGADLPATVSIACVYGRQTDQEPHVIAYDVAADRIDDIKTVLSDALPEGQLEVGEQLPTPLMSNLDPRPVRLRDPQSLAELTTLNREFTVAAMPQRALAVQINLFGGRSLSDVVDDESMALQRAIYVRILEGYERLQTIEGGLDRIREVAKVDALPPLKVTAEQAGRLCPADYFRVDTSELDTMGIYYLAAATRQIGARLESYRFATELVEKVAPTASTDDEKQMALQGYLMAISSAPEPTIGISTANQAVAFAKLHQLNYSPVLMMQMELCLMTADQEGFRSTIMEIEQNYGNDPAVMARVQQILVQLGVIRPDGSMRGAPAGPVAPGNDFVPAPAPQQAANPASEGLWTPDSPGGGDSSEGGGGKLWVPGMD